MTLTELKTKATELGLTPEYVRAYGNLSKKAIWELAIANIEDVSTKPNNIAVTVNQSTRSGWWHKTKKTSTAEGHVEIDGELPEPNNIAVTVNQSDIEATEIACLIDHPALCEGELLKPAPDSDYLGKDDRGLPTHWALTDTDADKVDIYSLKPSAPITPILTIENIEEKLLNCLNPSKTPLRDELTQRMARYVGDGMTSQEFESLQNEPLDEYTAAVYLGWLEGSEQILVEV